MTAVLLLLLASSYPGWYYAVTLLTYPTIEECLTEAARISQDLEAIYPADSGLSVECGLAPMPDNMTEDGDER